MIARMWRGRTRAADTDRYLDYLHETGLSAFRATPGNRGAYVFRKIDGEETEFLIVSLWEGLDAIERFAGADYETAVYYPEDESFLLELEPKVAHYEIVYSTNEP